jgi:hypothetical protein
VQSAPRQDPERRTDRRDAAENEDPGSHTIQIGTSVRSMDRIDAKGVDCGKVRLGVITRAGDEALRSVLVVGATSVIQHSAHQEGVTLACRTSQAQVAEVGRRGTRKQDCAHRKMMLQ